MTGDDRARLIQPISQREFDLYGLSLDRGPNFDPLELVSTYKLGRGSASGCILFDPQRQAFKALTLRRRVDHCWVLVDETSDLPTPEAALERIGANMRHDESAEPLPPGARRRAALLKPGSRGTSPEFDLLTSTVDHLPALMAVGECYLALPNPDPNFVTDFQTSNFASRLFELYLLTCFREHAWRRRCGLVVRERARLGTLTGNTWPICKAAPTSPQASNSAAPTCRLTGRSRAARGSCAARRA